MSAKAWVRNVFRPAIVAGMVGCVALSFVDLIQVFFPSWSGAYIVTASVLVSLEANYSYRLVRSRNLRGADVLRFRIVEIAMFLILVRIGSFVGRSWTDVWGELSTWPQEPHRVIDLEVSYAFILTLLSWVASTRTTYDLERIGEPPVRDKYYVYPIDALTGRFFWGGAILLWNTGVTRIGLSALLDLDRPSVPGLVLNVLVYFALGLVMLGQTQYARLSKRWRKEGIEVHGGLSNHWVRYTILFLLLTGLIAFLLPTGYTVPLLDVVSTVIGAVLYAFHVIFQVVIFLIFLVLAPLARLLQSDPVDRRPLDPMPPPELPRAAGNGSPAGWLEIVRSVAFWVTAIAVVVYIVRSYLRDRPELIEKAMRLEPLRAVRSLFLRLWRELMGLIRAAQKRVRIRVRLGRGEETDGEGSERRGSGLFRIGGLSRQDRALYYYLSILGRAARQGYPRDPSETPYEYGAHFGQNVPEAEQEMIRLTEAFVETRYSTHRIEREREGRLRSDWKKVRATLRSLKDRWRGSREAGREGGPEGEADSGG